MREALRIRRDRPIPVGTLCNTARASGVLSFEDVARWFGRGERCGRVSSLSVVAR